MRAVALADGSVNGDSDICGTPCEVYAKGRIRIGFGPSVMTCIGPTRLEGRTDEGGDEVIEGMAIVKIPSDEIIEAMSGATKMFDDGGFGDEGFGKTADANGGPAGEASGPMIARDATSAGGVAKG